MLSKFLDDLTGIETVLNSNPSKDTKLEPIEKVCPNTPNLTSSDEKYQKFFEFRKKLAMTLDESFIYYTKAFAMISNTEVLSSSQFPQLI